MTSESLYRQLTPTKPLRAGETLIASFSADRATYIRDHVKLAGMAMVLGMAVLWILGNPHIWTGAVGGLFAIAVRGFYLASDDLKARWDMTDQRLLGPGGRAVDLAEIARVRPILSAVQVVTKTGDKHLIKYLNDRHEVVKSICSTRDATGGLAQ